MVAKEQHLEEIRGKQEGSLNCRAKDIGMAKYVVCLESSMEGRACEHRFAFGFDHLCASPERIEQMRKR